MNYDMSKGKQAAIEFMNNFHPDRTWWIVGGMLRDSAMDRGYKDIDIFINGRDTDLLPDEGTDHGDKNAFLLRAYTVREYPYEGDTFEINLIFMRGNFWDLEQMSDRCDFGICQIGWEPTTNRTYRSEAFFRDMQDNTLTMTRETSKERVQRMQAKFPHHLFRNPQNLTTDGTRCWCYNEETSQLEVRHDQLITRDGTVFTDVAAPPKIYDIDRIEY